MFVGNICAVVIIATNTAGTRTARTIEELKCCIDQIAHVFLGYLKKEFLHQKMIVDPKKNPNQNQLTTQGSSSSKNVTVIGCEAKLILRLGAASSSL